MADVGFVLDGRAVSVPDDGMSLLEVLRERLGERSAKDGCSPQGQCGCCTVLVDGQPRVACVTPWPGFVGGGSPPSPDWTSRCASRWAAAMCATGGSHAGSARPGSSCAWPGLTGLTGLDHGAVDRALGAHLCRCTGWQTIHEAAASIHEAAPTTTVDSGRADTADDGRRSAGRPPTRPVVISRRRRGGRDSRVARRRPSDRSSPSVGRLR